MRIVLISDLHGNEVALRAVLADVDRSGCDEIVCLGDVATLGPAPNAVIQLLRERTTRRILGNHDDFMLNRDLIHSYTEVPIVVESVEWCRARLGDDEIAFLRTFQPNLEIALGGGSTLVLFHGTLRSHMEDLLATTPPEEVDAMLLGRRGTVMAGGHTHLQMTRQHRGILIVNPGSVGLPFREHLEGRPPVLLDHAEYAVIEERNGAIGVQLRRVPVDRAAMAAAIAATDNPIRHYLLGQYGR
ncbi:MAG: protein phosphatase [Polyangiaceae bacterium UTPRO1]|jgi:putative phosphoesterase|nr:metallophosphoesterase family protein [Myxococcales bacterium]OQY67222.1 MAG: protein phosphatase [Polyangiaceae bacterium UTPRO1]